MEWWFIQCTQKTKGSYEYWSHRSDPPPRSPLNPVFGINQTVANRRSFRVHGGDTNGRVCRPLSVAHSPHTRTRTRTLTVSSCCPRTLLVFRRLPLISDRGVLVFSGFSRRRSPVHLVDGRYNIFGNNSTNQTNKTLVARIV